MKQHKFDPLSFIFGLIFLAMAVTAVVDSPFDWDIGRWLLPGAVLVLGIGLLASALRTTKKESSEES